MAPHTLSGNSFGLFTIISAVCRWRWGGNLSFQQGGSLDLLLLEICVQVLSSVTGMTEADSSFSSWWTLSLTDVVNVRLEAGAFEITS